LDWLITTLTYWYEHSRWLYATATVVSLLTIGLLAAIIGEWLLKKLGRKTSDLSHD